MTQIDIFDTTGKYHGSNPTETERASGVEVEKENRGPLKRNKAGHKVLRVYERMGRLTSYHASYFAVGDYHSKRRESTRLMERGFLRKNGVMANPAPAGRGAVDAYEITMQGREELRRLDQA